MNLLITGGIAGRFSRIREFLGKEREIVNGCIDLLDTSTGNVQSIKRIKLSRDYYDPEHGRDFRVTSAHLHNGFLYVGCPTRVFVIDESTFEIVRHIDSPYFHDVHHVCVIDDTIYVVNTGLVAVITFTMQGEFLAIKSIIADDIWEKFDKDKDYRKIGSLKPHKSHPNYIFKHKDKIWVTRFRQKDAVNLDNLNETIQVYDTAAIHDGVSFDESVFFTTVDGHVLEIDFSTGERINDYDINAAHNRGVPLGWCRGLHVTNEYLYVGFSTIRNTKIEDNLAWLKSSVTKKKYQKKLPSRVVKYNRKDRRIEEEYEISYPNTDMIFSVLKFGE